MGGKASKAVRDRAQKRYRTAHPDRIQSLWTNWYATAKNDPEWLKRRAASKHDSYLRTKAKRLAASQRWAEANRVRVNAAYGKFRVKQRGGEIGEVDYALVVRDSCGICGICKQVFDGNALHFDHIVPISKGGSHTQNNIQLVHARCNSLKGTRVMKAG